MTHREKQGLTALTILILIILLALLFGKLGSRPATESQDASETAISAQLSATDTLPAADSVPSRADTIRDLRTVHRMHRIKHPVMRLPNLKRDRLSPHDRPMR